jgi:hypothetical protein
LRTKVALLEVGFQLLVDLVSNCVGEGSRYEASGFGKPLSSGLILSVK